MFLRRKAQLETGENAKRNSPAGVSRSENKVCVTHKAIVKQREQEYITESIQQTKTILDNQSRFKEGQIFLSKSFSCEIIKKNDDSENFLKNRIIHVNLSLEDINRE